MPRLLAGIWASEGIDPIVVPTTGPALDVIDTMTVHTNAVTATMIDVDMMIVEVVMMIVVADTMTDVLGTTGTMIAAVALQGTRKTRTTDAVTSMPVHQSSCLTRCQFLTGTDRLHQDTVDPDLLLATDKPSTRSLGFVKQSIY